MPLPTFAQPSVTLLRAPGALLHGPSGQDTPAPANSPDPPPARAGAADREDGDTPWSNAIDPAAAEARGAQVIAFALRLAQALSPGDEVVEVTTNLGRASHLLRPSDPAGALSIRRLPAPPRHDHRRDARRAPSRGSLPDPKPAA